jgi:phosphate transport system permease protein
MVQEDKQVERASCWRKAGPRRERVKIEEVDFAASSNPCSATLPAYREDNANSRRKLEAVLATAPAMPAPELQARLDRFKQLDAEYLAGFPAVERNLETWDYRAPCRGRRRSRRSCLAGNG